MTHEESTLARLRRALFDRPSAKRIAGPPDPAKVFDAAIAEKTARHDALKQSVAGMFYLRNKLEGDLRELRAELARAHHELRDAVRSGDEGLALELIAGKQAQHEELERAERQLEDVRRECAEAKEHLARSQGELRALEREKLQILATLKTASARTRMEAALESLAVPDAEPGTTQLDRVREHVARVAMERSLERELSGPAELARLHMESTLAELRRLKQELRRPLRALAEGE